MRLVSLIAALLATPTVAQTGDADVPPCGLYVYKAEIVRVIDGDTVEADIDLGFHTWRRGEHLRLARIDAPEVRGSTKEAGQASAAVLRERIEGRELFVCTVKDAQGSFGRYLVEIYDGPDHTNVNDWMVSAGHAVPYE